MFSLSSKPNMAAAVICVGFVGVVSGCTSIGPDHPASIVEPRENRSSRLVGWQDHQPQPIIIQPRRTVPIDPDWPRRVANIVGFAPPDIAEDYTAQFMATSTGRAVGETLVLVRRRGNWVRIDEHYDRNVGSRFINLSTETVVTVDDGAPAGRPTVLAVEPLLTEPWNGQARLVALRKETLSDAEVMPPAHLFDLQTWTGRISPGVEGLSYSVVLRQACCDAAGSAVQNDTTLTLIERRRGRLTYREHLSAEQRSLSVADDRGGFQFSAAYTRDGRLVRLLLNTFSRPRLTSRAKDDQSTEMVLGEICRWEDSAPGLEDATWQRCLATDGAPLIEVSGGRGRLTRLTAVSISREPLPLIAVLPPSAAFTSVMQ